MRRDMEPTLLTNGRQPGLAVAAAQRLVAMGENKIMVVWEFFQDLLYRLAQKNDPALQSFGFSDVNNSLSQINIFPSQGAGFTGT
ncbi:hypothetical protein MASR2M66_07100 [Chloroflexota bacterium]